MSTISNKDIDDILEGTHIKANTVITQEDELSDLEEDETISRQAEQAEIDNEFKKNVIEYVRIDDQIRERNQEVKELKKNKKPCEDFIIRFLDSKEETLVNLTGQRITRTQSNNKAALKQEMILNTLIEEFKKNSTEEEAKEKAELLLENMNNKRPTTIRNKLKRTFDRKKEPKEKTSKKKTPKKATLKKMAEQFKGEVV